MNCSYIQIDIIYVSLYNLPHTFEKEKRKDQQRGRLKRI
jgi:hypothetical protein